MKVIFFTILLSISLSIFGENPNKNKRKTPPGLQKKIDGMSDDQKAAFKEKMKKRRAEIQEKMKDMSPEERQAFIKEMKEKRGQKGQRPDFENMTDEEKAAYREKKKSKMQEKMKDMSPEEKEAFINKMKEKRDNKGNQKGDDKKGPNQQNVPEGIEPVRP